MHTQSRVVGGFSGAAQGGVRAHGDRCWADTRARRAWRLDALRRTMRRGSARAGPPQGTWDEVCSPKMQWRSLLALADLFVINRPHTHTRHKRRASPRSAPRAPTDGAPGVHGKGQLGPIVPAEGAGAIGRAVGRRITATGAETRFGGMPLAVRAAAGNGLYLQLGQPEALRPIAMSLAASAAHDPANSWPPGGARCTGKVAGGWASVFSAGRAARARRNPQSGPRLAS